MANLNVFRAHPIFDGLAHVALWLSSVFATLINLSDCMEKTGVQPEYMSKNDIHVQLGAVSKFSDFFNL